MSRLRRRARGRRSAPLRRRGRQAAGAVSGPWIRRGGDPIRLPQRGAPPRRDRGRGRRDARPRRPRGPPAGPPPRTPDRRPGRARTDRSPPVRGPWAGSPLRGERSRAVPQDPGARNDPDGPAVEGPLRQTGHRRPSPSDGPVGSSSIRQRWPRVQTNSGRIVVVIAQLPPRTGDPCGTAPRPYCLIAKPTAKPTRHA